MCPECGSSSSHALDVGYDAEGRRVRKRQCKVCGTEYTTIEVYVPVGFHRIDDTGRDQRREERRRAQGFKGVQNRKPHVSPVVMVRVQVYDPENDPRYRRRKSNRTRTP